MKRSLKNLLVSLSANTRFHRFLDRNIALSQRLLGIGSGDAVDSSGEVLLALRLREQYRHEPKPLCVFDVGSNEGQFLAMIANGLSGLPATIHAFEPGRCTYDSLRRNSREHPNVILNNFGLGSMSAEVELYYDKAGSGSASLSKRRLEHRGIEFGRSERVAIKRLDDYCLEANVEQIDLLKLDVEGHELDVLHGGLRMFQAKKIRMVSFEFGGCNIDSRTYLQDFWYFFQTNGMRSLFRITPSGFLSPIRQYSESLEQFLTTNFVAILD